MTRVLSPKSIAAGDVLVCYNALMRGEPGSERGYCHVAICLGSDEVLESNLKGVRVTSVSRLLADSYDHLAVLRAPETWSPLRVRRLREFASTQLGKRFNLDAIPSIEYLKEQNLATAQAQIEDYFESPSPRVQTDRDLYFCSELVVSAFIEAGIIAEPAAILFKPETLRPMDIAEDKVFGFFEGYIPKSGDYVVPGDDWFQTSI